MIIEVRLVVIICYTYFILWITNFAFSKQTFYSMPLSSFVMDFFSSCLCVRVEVICLMKIFSLKEQTNK